MPAPFAGIFSDFIFKPVLRPIIRFICGLIAIPIFRLIMRKVCRVDTHNEEMERDLETWFRGALLLLVATANMESILFDWSNFWQKHDHGLGLALRLLLAVGVIESMPDENLFSIIHRGPPKLKLTSRAGWKEAWRRRGEVLRGFGVLHLRRSTPVFAIMAVILGPELVRVESGQKNPVVQVESAQDNPVARVEGAQNNPVVPVESGQDNPVVRVESVPGNPVVPVEAGRDYHVVGWWCYGLAIAQYLVIALITQRDKFEGLLDVFEREASAIRDEIGIRSGGASAVVCDGDDDLDANIQPARRD